MVGAVKIQFVSQSARDSDNPAGNPSRLINGFFEPMVAGGRAVGVLRAVPGMADFASINSVFARAMLEYNGDIYTIIGRNLYKTMTTGAVTLIGDVEATDEIAGLAKSTGYVVAVGGRKYWHWNGTTLATIATGSITSPASVAYLGGYVIVSQYNGRTFGWSGLANPITWSGLDFASAEITDDPIIRLVAFKDALLIFKRSGYERWAVTGAAGPDAFQRIGGAQEEPGLSGYGLIVTFPNGLSYIGSDGKVHVVGIGPISTPPVEVAIEKKQPQRLFYYEQRGHGFICIAFRDTAAWCYDIATGEWHERDENGLPWTARASVKVGSDWYVATDAGKIAKLSAPCLDFGNPMVRRYVSRTLEAPNSARFNISSVEAFPRIWGDVQGDGDLSQAKVTLRTSRDGVTFGPPKDRGVGLAGLYETRLVWRQLGQFRRATVEISQSATVDIPLLAEIDVVI